jgi:hypothetical protein
MAQAGIPAARLYRQDYEIVESAGILTPILLHELEF